MSTQSDGSHATADPGMARVSDIDPLEASVGTTECRITVIGAMPPPYGGAAKNTAIIADALERKGVDVVRLDTAVKGSVLHQRGLRYHLNRLSLFCRNMTRLVGCKLAYMVPDGGLGLLYTLGYVIHLRVWGARFYFHHRNYSHINRPNAIMRTILLLSNRRATHIFLDGEMRRAFDAAYSVTTDKRVVTNAATNDVSFPASRTGPQADSDKVVIGYLSNLTNEKGFDVTVDAFEELASISPRFQFMLGGEPAGAIERERLESAIRVLGDRLDHRGAVFGEAKARFFADVDIFVFPTRFKQEAQPNVIYEAMVAGCYIIATARACIPEMLRGIPSSLVEDDADLTANLVQQIVRAAECDDWTARSEAIRIAYARVVLESRQNFDALLSELVASSCRREVKRGAVACVNRKQGHS